MGLNDRPTFANASPLDYRTADALSAYRVLFYPTGGDVRVFIHPPEGQHGPIRRIIFDVPIPSHMIGCRPGVHFAVPDTIRAEHCSYVPSSKKEQFTAARTAEQMAEDLLSDEFDM